MPSFCWPLALGPKPAMRRPFTGQRNVGVVPSAALACVLAGGAGSAGVTTFTVCTSSLLACLPGAFGAGAAAGLPDADGAPGMTMRSPILIRALGARLLALRMSMSGL